METTFLKSPSKAFMSTSGVMAMPAGLPGGVLGKPVNPMALEVTWNSTMSPARSTFAKPTTVSAPIAPAGWHAAEPRVCPIHEQQAAGVDSVVDNTMRIRPLPPRFGKTREISPAEVAPPFRILAPDKLSVAKGVNIDALEKLDSPERLTSVLPPYSPSAALFDNHYPPDRLVSGFMAHPKALTQQAIVDPATAAYKTSFKYTKPSPSSSPSSTMQKFDFDQTASHAHIPVKSRKMLFPGVADRMSATDFMMTGSTTY